MFITLWNIVWCHRPSNFLLHGLTLLHQLCVNIFVNYLLYQSEYKREEQVDSLKKPFTPNQFFVSKLNVILSNFKDSAILYFIIF